MPRDRELAGRTDVERELDGVVDPDRDLDLTRPLPAYEQDLVVDGVSVNALGGNVNQETLPPTMGTDERAEHLDNLIAAAGHCAVAGYRVEDDVVGWVIDGMRRLVLAEEGGHAWLFAEVGLRGGGVYPEDDLAEEAEIDLPAEHLLWWDDNVERAVVARHVGVGVNADELKRAVDAFGEFADAIERRLTSIEELDVAASPSGTDPLERGAFVPPRP